MKHVLTIVAVVMAIFTPSAKADSESDYNLGKAMATCAGTLKIAAARVSQIDSRTAQKFKGAVDEYFVVAMHYFWKSGRSDYESLAISYQVQAVQAGQFFGLEDALTNADAICEPLLSTRKRVMEEIAARSNWKAKP